tara:strand:+ start:817 stop:1056 length:240 start_codon:yes stop_codon:yes gene_type:complete
MGHVMVRLESVLVIKDMDQVMDRNVVAKNYVQWIVTAMKNTANVLRVFVNVKIHLLVSHAKHQYFPVQTTVLDMALAIQ